LNAENGNELTARSCDVQQAGTANDNWRVGVLNNR
jgi:hypothetical protein